MNPASAPPPVGANSQPHPLPYGGFAARANQRPAIFSLKALTDGL